MLLGEIRRCLPSEAGSFVRGGWLALNSFNCFCRRVIGAGINVWLVRFIGEEAGEGAGGGE